MRPTRQTIAKTRLVATLLLGFPVLVGHSQVKIKPSGTGVQPPSNKDLIEKSNKSSVKADAIWIEISNVGKNPARWVLDINREGSCYVLRDKNGGRTIYGGSGISPELVKRAFTELTKRSVIYADRKRSTSLDKERQFISIGMATWDGSRVYKTQSGSLDTYPDTVRKLVAELRKESEKLPPSEQAMGSIQSTFMRPAESRTLIQSGKRIVKVEDPGRGATELSTLEMALRLPGRDIVVPTADDWDALKTYVMASNPGAPESGEFFVQSSSRVYRIAMNPAVAPVGGDIDESQIPKARPVAE